MTDIYTISCPEECCNLATYITEYPPKRCIFHSKDETIRGLLEICSAIEYLHTQNIVHGKLSCYSILVNGKSGILRLSRVEDRVVTKNKSDKHDGLVSEAKGFLAPEVLILDHYVETSDVYSLGVLMWFFLTKRVPYENRPVREVHRDVVNNKMRPPLNVGDVTRASVYDKNSSISYIDLIQGCWKQKFEDRITLKELITSIKTLTNNDRKSLKAEAEGAIQDVTLTI